MLSFAVKSVLFIDSQQILFQGILQNEHIQAVIEIDLLNTDFLLSHGSVKFSLLLVKRFSKETPQIVEFVNFSIHSSWMSQ